MTPTGASNPQSHEYAKGQNLYAVIASPFESDVRCIKEKFSVGP